MEDIDFIIECMTKIKKKLIEGKDITDKDIKNFDVLLKNLRLLQDKSTENLTYLNEFAEVSSEDLKQRFLQLRS